MKSLSIPCPACSAAKGVNCNTTKLEGYGFPQTHRARVNAARRLNKQLNKPATNNQ